VAILRKIAPVDPQKCNGCEKCIPACRISVIEMENGKAVVQDGSVDCGNCVDECSQDAIDMA